MLTEFRYYSGEVVMVGDHVREHGQVGLVEMIIQPGTELTECFYCPEGGVMLLFADGGRLLMDPPDGIQWEDLEFIRRAVEGPYDANLAFVCMVIEDMLVDEVVGQLHACGIRLECVRGARRTIICVSEKDAPRARNLLRHVANRQAGLTVIEGAEMPL
jgi:hypothetical protein